MADDIDIEEHDVLDNPRIKRIFPDLTRVKTETPDFEDQDDSMNFAYNYENHTTIRDGLRFEESEVEYTRHNNKIILGRKPCGSSNNLSASNSSHNVQSGNPSIQIFGNDSTQTIKSEPLSEGLDDMELEDYHNPSPVIIVGSKPTQEKIDETVDENDIKDAVVLLEDWGPRLNTSSCYCKDCEILFPTRNCLDFHNSSAHSFLVALDSDGAGNRSRNTARKSTMPERRNTSKAKLCYYCNKTFPDNTALIQHLYTSCVELNGKPQPAPTTDSESNTGTYYRCDVCTCYFRRKIAYTRHMLAHGVTLASFQKHLFNGQCLNCISSFKLEKNYNQHIRKAHKRLYCKNGKTAQAMMASKSSLGAVSEAQYPANKVKPKFTQNTVHSSKLHQNAGQTSKLPRNMVQNVTSLQNTGDQVLYKYKCCKCHEIFNSYYSANKHKYKKHPEYKNHCLYQKILVRKHTTPTHALEALKMPEHTNSPATEDLPSQLVPKDILFKCDHCQIHFTSCSIAVLHSRNCIKNKDDWKCQQCKRTFIFQEKTIHQRQHEVSERFNVYAVEENLYGKVLCQCPHCDLYLHEKDFWAHFNLGCRPTKPVNCKSCDLPIHVSSLVEHNKWHRNIKISRNNSILIEFHVRASEDATEIAKPVKRKITAEVSERPPKEAKIQVIKKRNTEMTMFYCTFCKCCILGRKYIKHHYKGQCRTKAKMSKICRFCGLVTSSCRHPNLHKGSNKMKIGDYRFVRIQDNKPINPPIPVYPRCNKCDVHFISTVAWQKHDCNDSSKTCRYCKHKFSDLAYKLHVPFHEYRPPGKATKGDVSETPKTHQKTKTPQATRPLKNIDRQLLKNYLLLTESWNILYLCEVCDIVCDSYDKMVEHSQNHYSHMESYDMTVKSCQKCDLRFDSTCFEKHREMHITNATINKDSFHIFTYNYTNLLSDDWYKLFGDLPKAQIDRIVSQSIYNYSRTVKMRVIKDGPQGHTLYKCDKCEKYVNPLTLAQHYRYTSCAKNIRKYRCGVCNIVFSSITGRNNHALAHNTNKNKTFRTVLINEDNDEGFNAAMRSDTDKTLVESPVNTNASKKPTMELKGVNERKFIYYQCKLCECCISDKDNLKRHVCSVGARARRCLQCGLSFRSPKMYIHETLHNTLPEFVRKNMNIIRFDPTNSGHLERESSLEPEEKVAKIYKCRCGLHFVSSKTVHKHLEVCGPKYKISKENCSKCGLLFPTNDLVSHLCSHHSNDKFTRFEVEELAPDEEESNKSDDIKGIYKCNPCDCYFLSNSGLKNHYKMKHVPRYKIGRCNICGLKFSVMSLDRHMKYHHMRFKCQLKDMHITAYDASMKIAHQSKRSSQSKNTKQSQLSKKVISQLDSNAYNKNLYRCIPCDVYFLTRSGLVSHFSTEAHENRDTSLCVRCDACGLPFNTHSLMKHNYIHHEKLNLSRKQFRIVTPKLRDNMRETYATLPKKLKLKSYKQFRKEKECSNTIYKCLECDVHYITNDGFQKHLTRHYCIKNPVPCKVCGLKFTSHTVSRHEYLHHQIGNLELKDFRIESNRTRTFTSAQEQYTDATAGSNKDLDPTDLNEVGVSTADVIHESKEPNKIEDWFERVLYRCDKCPVNFLSLSGLENHKSEMEHGLPKMECDICHLMFTTHTLYKHHQEIQHEKHDFKLEDLWIIGRMNAQNETPIDSLIYSEWLYKCSKCSIHFLTRSTFDDHLTDCDREAPKTQCIVCDLVFSRDSISNHFKIHHEILRLKIENFLIVEESKKHAIEENISSMETENETVVRNNGPVNSEEIMYIDDEEYTQTGDNLEVTDEPQNESAENTLSKSAETVQNIKSDNVLSIKSLYSNYLFKCDICAVHFMSEDALSKHVAFNKHSSPRANCGYCGLDFSKSNIMRHKEVHHMKMKLFLKDLKVVLGASEGDRPVNNLLYKCTLCHLHFVTEPAHDRHMCEPDVDFDALNKCRCTICGLSFHLQGLQRHKYFHHKKMDLKRDDFVIVLPRNDKDESATEKVVKEHNYFTKPKKGHDYSTKHEEEHDDSTKHEKSIRFTLSEKYKSMLKMSTYKEYLYYCSNCNMHFMLPRSLERHRCQHKPPVSKSKCSSCNLWFSARSLALHQYIHHETMGLIFEDLQVLNETGARTFNSNVSVGDASEAPMGVDDNSSTNTHDDTVDFGDETNLSNAASTSIGETSVESPKRSNKLRSCRLTGASKILDYMELNDNSSISTLNDENSIVLGDETNTSIASTSIGEHGEDNLNKSKIKSSRSYTLSAAYKASLKLSSYSNTLYKCGVCSLHYLDSKSLDKHIGLNCDRNYNTNECPICGLTFTFITIERHKYIHHELLRFKREDMKVVCIMRSADSKREKSATDRSISKTDMIEQVISKYSTRKTQKVVPQDPDVVENEIPISESTILQSDTEITTITLDDSDDDTAEVSVSALNKLPLTKSPLNISKSGKEKKIDKSTSKPTVVAEKTSSEDIESSVDEVNSTKVSVDCDATAKTKHKVMLYKCGECNVYFITQSTCYKHIIKHKPIDNIEFIDCKMCGLAFRILTLRKHMSAHHTKEFNLEDVLIEEYQPNSQEIDIYSAIDKVQSRLVSTTSDVSNKDIDTTEVEQSNKQSGVVTKSPEIAINTEVVTNYQENDAQYSNTDTKAENFTNSQDVNGEVFTGSVPTQTTDKEKVIDIPKSQSTENIYEESVVDVTEPKPNVNAEKI